ncbi:tRNA (guanosine(46)-N7)-methyltransferase TrmB [Boudabousia tangfeifanii]|uniref:tRNA (guanine-N(7)-)-methyltransferase n=2 Tax=Boudabousia tangfeifanii TaxID=1912795 RepID=A0A1D9MMX6_9ACTO|nr:tRNA (guanosine(46)-N7)-methyltransferase TrmB [Boudabousia tangfeifanii]
MLDPEEHESLPDGRFLARTKSFVRRGTRMPKSLQNTWDQYANDFLIEVGRTTGKMSVDPSQDLELPTQYPSEQPLIVEIGCGGGDQLIAAAQRWPDHNFLGLEVWRPGLAKTVSKAVAAGVENVKLIEADATAVLSHLLPEAYVSEVWTFFPDPWRKARHHKRRLVQVEFAGKIAHVLKDGGIWRLATDWDDYAWHMRDVVEAAEDFANPYLGQNPDQNDPEPERGGYAPRFSGRVITRFEQRGLDAGRQVHDLVGVRLPREER